jgi:hypothetical protein
MRKSASVPLVATLAAASMYAAGCGGGDQPEPQDQQAVCMDRGDLDNPNDDRRLDDSQCASGDHDQHGDDDTNLILWMFLLSGSRAPAVGQVVNISNYGGHYSPPPANTPVTRGGAPKAGGTIPRGGFGGGTKSGTSGG